jgi:hypothetical protein
MNNATVKYIIRELFHDFHPKPAWSCMKYRLKCVLSTVITMCCMLVLLPVTVVLLCCEPILILIRWAVSRIVGIGEVVEEKLVQPDHK